jgi:hypothetical protein
MRLQSWGNPTTTPRLKEWRGIGHFIVADFAEISATFRFVQQSIKALPIRTLENATRLTMRHRDLTVSPRRDVAERRRFVCGRKKVWSGITSRENGGQLLDIHSEFQ